VVCSLRAVLPEQHTPALRAAGEAATAFESLLDEVLLRLLALPEKQLGKFHVNREVMFTAVWKELKRGLAHLLLAGGGGCVANRWRCGPHHACAFVYVLVCMCMCLTLCVRVRARLCAVSEYPPELIDAMRLRGLDSVRGGSRALPGWVDVLRISSSGFEWLEAHTGHPGMAQLRTELLRR
jgi:hypothetical protein